MQSYCSSYYRYRIFRLKSSSKVKVFHRDTKGKYAFFFNANNFVIVIGCPLKSRSRIFLLLLHDFAHNVSQRTILDYAIVNDQYAMVLGRYPYIRIPNKRPQWRFLSICFDASKRSPRPVRKPWMQLQRITPHRIWFRSTLYEIQRIYRTAYFPFSKSF